LARESNPPLFLVVADLGSSMNEFLDDKDLAIIAIVIIAVCAAFGPDTPMYSNAISAIAGLAVGRKVARPVHPGQDPDSGRPKYDFHGDDKGAGK